MPSCVLTFGSVLTKQEIRSAQWGARVSMFCVDDIGNGASLGEARSESQLAHRSPGTTVPRLSRFAEDAFSSALHYRRYRSPAPLERRRRRTLWFARDTLNPFVEDKALHRCFIQCPYSSGPDETPFLLRRSESCSSNDSDRHSISLRRTSAGYYHAEIDVSLVEATALLWRTRDPFNSPIRIS